MKEIVAEAAAPTAAQDLLANLPKLHHWGGEDQVGGLTSAIGERMINELGSYDSPRVIETGAGASTLLFCCLDPGAIVSIAPNGELRYRIFAEATTRQISVKRLFFVCDRSELALPRIAADRNRFDVGLIDGSHNWPSVFVDFCYINMMMPAGGTLFVDDIHLHSVSELFKLPFNLPDSLYSVPPIARDTRQCITVGFASTKRIAQDTLCLLEIGAGFNKGSLQFAGLLLQHTAFLRILRHIQLLGSKIGSQLSFDSSPYQPPP